MRRASLAGYALLGMIGGSHGGSLLDHTPILDGPSPRVGPGVRSSIWGESGRRVLGPPETDADRAVVTAAQAKRERRLARNRRVNGGSA